jgi:hypothetical protein
MIVAVAVLAWFLYVGDAFDRCPHVPGRPGEWIKCARGETSVRALALEVPPGALQ